VDTLGNAELQDASAMATQPELIPVPAGRSGSGRTWASVHVPHVRVVAAGLCAAAALAILYASRRFDFFFDEWDFVLVARSWGLRDYFLPHNEHWSTVPMAIYKLLLDVNGMHSYLPFMAALLVLHATAAMLLFLIVRRRGGDLPALSAAAVLLVLGTGWMDILWAFQIGFLTSVVTGLLAIYLLDGERAGVGRQAAAAVALLLGVMSSGVGPVFCVAVGVELALDRDRRRRLAVLGLPVAAYAIWYLAIARTSPDHIAPTFNLQALASFVPYGLGAAAAGVLGLGAAWSQLSFAALAVVCALVAVSWYRGRRIDSRFAGAIAGLLAQYLVIGLVRAQFGDAEAATSRYVYVGAVFLLLAVAPLARDLPWRGLWPAALAVVAFAVAMNAVQLREAMVSRSADGATQRVELGTVWLFRDAPSLDRSAVVDRHLMPQVRAGSYIAARDFYGSPLQPLDAGELASLPSGEVNQTLANVLPIRVSTAAATAGGGAGCTPIGAASSTADVAVPAGSTVAVRSDERRGAVTLKVWLAGSPPETPTWTGLVASDQRLLIGMPSAGSPLTWHVRVQLPPGASGSACVS
jgi:hypothetical protein